MTMPSSGHDLKRLFVCGCLTVLLTGVGAAPAPLDPEVGQYAFAYLGDLHFDRDSHHDFDWVRAAHSNDIAQIEGYVRTTSEYTPDLLRRLQTRAHSRDNPIRMVIQGGDLTEGLCGSRALQERQFNDTLGCIRQYLPETPFFMVKGNHDITGPGAREAFDAVMLPWLSLQCGKPVESASFHFMQGGDLYVFFDAYHANDLGWLERTLRGNKHRHAFVVMHPPAVPYTARSTWFLFSREQERARRAEFLNILGAHRVILLTAHLHKYSILARKTPAGRFVQVSMGSVISSPAPAINDALEGVEAYGRSLLDLEPSFEPETRLRRQQILDDEESAITHFEYADFPGYAVIRVSDEGVELTSYIGHSDQVWRKRSLSAMLD